MEAVLGVLLAAALGIGANGAELAKPIQGPSDGGSAGAAVGAPAAPGDMPMDISTGRPRIVASVNGRPAEVVEFDTGSTGAVVQRAYVDKHKLPITGEVALRSPFENTPPMMAKTVRIDSIVVGGITLRNVRAVVLEDKGFVGADAPLIIGPDEFPRHVITLDYPASRFSLTAARPVGKAGWQRRKPGSQLETSIEVQGQRIALLIDSGNPGVLMLPKSVADRIDPAMKLIPVGAIRTVDREIPILIGNLNRDARLASVAARLGHTIFAEVPFANLGSQGLLPFRLTIDNPRRRWRLDHLGAGPVMLDSAPRRQPDPAPTGNRS